MASTDLLPNLAEYVVPGRKYLWISFSRSGDSPEGVAVLEQAIQLYPEVAHLVVTCNAQARMAEICKGSKRACVVVLDDAVNDRSLAMTSSFTNMVVMGQCLANAWSIEEYAQVLEQLVRAGEADAGAGGGGGRADCGARVLRGCVLSAAERWRAWRRSLR